MSSDGSQVQGYSLQLIFADGMYDNGGIGQFARNAFSFVLA